MAQTNNQPDMWKNYILVAFRNLWKSRFFSLINILGLALGIACFLFIIIFVKDELSYDSYHENAGRLYRMHFLGKLFGQEIDIATVGDPWGPLLVSEYPAVEQQFRIRETGAHLVHYGEQAYREEHTAFADSTLFSLFSLHLLSGNPQTALAEPNSVVVSSDVARKYFGEEEPMGKMLIFDDKNAYRVTGVMEPIPHNTHFNYDLLISMATLEESRSGQWLSFNFYTYLLLREGASTKDLERAFPQIIRTHVGSQLEKFVGQSYDDFLADGNTMDFSLFPVSRIHLYSHKADEIMPPGDIRYVYAFSFIGLFILLLACINFVNLSTARSASRAREVGMRKVVGAQRGQIIQQFLSESLVVSVLSLLLGVGLVLLLLPYFNQLSGKAISFSNVIQPWLLGIMALLAVVVGLLAGSYPAFFLSSFRPIKVLKGKFTNRPEGAWLRNGLVVFQFAITVGLIVGTIVIYNQLRYIQNKNLGYEKEHLLILNNAGGLGNKLEAFKQEMLKQPQVANATITSFLPTPSARNNNGHFLGRNPNPEGTQILQSWYVDRDFIETMGMAIDKGRNFSLDFPADSNAVIINEAAVKIFNLDEPLGKEISSMDGESDGQIEYTPHEVIGVVKDFHFESLRQPIQPLIIYLGHWGDFIVFRIKGDDIPGFINILHSRWDEMAANQPFDYNFLDGRYDAVYESETRIGYVIGIFTALAIFIASLGLFGLAAFTAEQRTKEIGIRKVMGASMPRLFMMMATDFIRWVMLASTVALPVAYIAMSRWLQGFAYRTDISAGNLILAVGITLIIALLTVSYQSLRVVLANPVNTLKYE